MHWRDLRPHEQADEVESDQEHEEAEDHDDVLDHEEDVYDYNRLLIENSCEGVLPFVAKYDASPAYRNTTRLIVGNLNEIPYKARTRCGGQHISYGDDDDVDNIWRLLMCHMNCNVEHEYHMKLSELSIEARDGDSFSLHSAHAMYRDMVSRTFGTSSTRAVIIPAFPVEQLFREAAEFRERVSTTENAGNLAAQHGRYMPNNEGYDEVAADFADLANDL